MKRPLVALLLLLSGCGDDKYRGDGHFAALTRTYIPVIGVSRGYEITMPTFVVWSDVTNSYSLAGMPRENASFNIELALCVHGGQLPTSSQEQPDADIPPGHEIHLSLVDKRSNTTLSEMTSSVRSLPVSTSRDLIHSPSIRSLMKVEFKDVPGNADLQINMNYRINGTPLTNHMMIVVFNNAPLA
jgi:hypothetical protein